jgi:hypothetical protein
MGRLQAYGTGDKKAEEVKSGELTTYCPACPQPGINLPTDWTEDAARHKLNFSDQACLILSNRWVYKHIFADHHLDRIRELIAEKSFQYSHVIHCSPRKSVTTCSRAAIKKLNLEIAVQCRLYARCRAWIVRLGADPGIQTRLRRYLLMTYGPALP